MLDAACTGGASTHLNAEKDKTGMVDAHTMLAEVLTTLLTFSSVVFIFGTSCHELTWSAQLELRL